MHELNDFVTRYEVQTYLVCATSIALVFLSKMNALGLSIVSISYAILVYAILVNVIEKGL